MNSLLNLSPSPVEAPAMLHGHDDAASARRGAGQTGDTEPPGESFSAALSRLQEDSSKPAAKQHAAAQDTAAESEAEAVKASEITQASDTEALADEDGNQFILALEAADEAPEQISEASVTAPEFTALSALIDQPQGEKLKALTAHVRQAVAALGTTDGAPTVGENVAGTAATDDPAQQLPLDLQNLAATGSQANAGNTTLSLTPQAAEAKDARTALLNGLKTESGDGKGLPQSGNSLPGELLNADEQSELPMGDRRSRSIPIDDAAMTSATKADKSLLNGLNFGEQLASRQAATALPAEGSAESNSTPATTESSNVLAASAVKADKSALLRGVMPTGLEKAASFSVDVHPNHPDWSNQVSNRIRWMGTMNISSAELKLHPAELGAIDITISTEDDQTRVNFVTSNPNTREIIESTMPRLREMLGGSGLQLEQGDVSHSEHANKNGQDELAGGREESGADTDVQETQISLRPANDKQVDYFV